MSTHPHLYDEMILNTNKFYMIESNSIQTVRLPVLTSPQTYTIGNLSQHDVVVEGYGILKMNCEATFVATQDSETGVVSFKQKEYAP